MVTNGSRKTQRVRLFAFHETFGAHIAMYLFTASLPKTLTFELTIKFCLRWIMTSYLLGQTNKLKYLYSLYILNSSKLDNRLLHSLFRF